MCYCTYDDHLILKKNLEGFPAFPCSVETRTNLHASSSNTYAPRWIEADIQNLETIPSLQDATLQQPSKVRRTYVHGAYPYPLSPLHHPNLTARRAYKAVPPQGRGDVTHVDIRLLRCRGIFL